MFIINILRYIYEKISKNSNHYIDYSSESDISAEYLNDEQIEILIKSERENLLHNQ